jgi:ribonuclease P protein component
MLKKTQRLTKRQFTTFFSQGRQVHTLSLRVVYSPHTQFHAAVVIPKKLVPKATARMKLRRRLYNGLRTLIEATHINGVFIIIIKATAVGASYHTLKKELEEVLQKSAGHRGNPR